MGLGSEVKGWVIGFTGFRVHRVYGVYRVYRVDGV